MPNLDDVPVEDQFCRDENVKMDGDQRSTARSSRAGTIHTVAIPPWTMSRPSAMKENTTRRHDPKAVHRPRNRGNSNLELQEDGSLDGDYFIGRSRNTSGRMQLRRVD
jgi:hypothetical protein